MRQLLIPDGGVPAQSVGQNEGRPVTCGLIPDLLAVRDREVTFSALNHGCLRSEGTGREIRTRG